MESDEFSVRLAAGWEQIPADGKTAATVWSVTEPILKKWNASPRLTMQIRTALYGSLAQFVKQGGLAVYIPRSTPYVAPMSITVMPIYEKSETLDAVATRLASGSLITSNDSETVFSRQWFADVSGRGTLAEEHGRSSNVLIGGGSALLLFTGTVLQNRDLDPLVTEALFDLFHAMIATFEWVPPETPETGEERAES